MAFSSGTCTDHYALFEIIRQAALAEGWVEERYVDNILDTNGEPNLELILNGSGVSGTEEIVVTMTTLQYLTTYRSISFGCATGFSSGDTLENQPNHSGQRWVSCWEQTIYYWLGVSDQRIHLEVNINGYYLYAYVGGIYPHQPPSYYRYPLVVIAGSTSPATKYSNSSYKNGLYDPDTNGNWALVMGFDGVWKYAYFYPLHNPALITGESMYTVSKALPTGAYPLEPVAGVNVHLPMTVATRAEGPLGDLEGLRYAPWTGVAVEDTITGGGETLTLFNDKTGTATIDFVAFLHE